MDIEKLVATRDTSFKGYALYILHVLGYMLPILPFFIFFIKVYNDNYVKIFLPHYYQTRKNIVDYFDIYGVPEIPLTRAYKFIGSTVIPLGNKYELHYFGKERWAIFERKNDKIITCSFYSGEGEDTQNYRTICKYIEKVREAHNLQIAERNLEKIRNS